MVVKVHLIDYVESQGENQTKGYRQVTMELKKMMPMNTSIILLFFNLASILSLAFVWKEVPWCPSWLTYYPSWSNLIEIPLPRTFPSSVTVYSASGNFRFDILS